MEDLKQKITELEKEKFNLLCELEDCYDEVNKLKEEIKDLEQQIEDFYKPKSAYEVNGLSEKDFFDF